MGNAVRTHRGWKRDPCEAAFRAVGGRPAPPIRVPGLDGCDILAAHGAPLRFGATGAAYGRPGGARTAGARRLGAIEL